MYVITVLFSIKSHHHPAFLQAITGNAKTSLADEPGCRQFDVCTSINRPSEIFLYEVYDNLEAFNGHLASSHFKDFNAQTADWVVAKVVNAFERKFANSHV